MRQSDEAVARLDLETAPPAGEILLVPDPDDERLADDHVFAFVQDPALRALCGDKRAQFPWLAPWLPKLLSSGGPWLGRAENPLALWRRVGEAVGWGVTKAWRESDASDANDGVDKGQCPVWIPPPVPFMDPANAYAHCDAVWAVDSDCFGYKPVPNCVTSFEGEGAA